MTKKPDLHEFKVELNPNQYGFAQQSAQGEKPKKHNPLDHDEDGRSGGHIDNKGKASKS